MAPRAVISAFVGREEAGVHSLKRKGGRLQSCFPAAARASTLHVLTRAAGSAKYLCSSASSKWRRKCRGLCTVMHVVLRYNCTRRLHLCCS